MTELSLSVSGKEPSLRKPVPANYDVSKYKYSFNEVRAEITKPFEEKLKRTKQLIRLFANSPNACLSCSFGKDSMAVLSLVLQENPKIPVNFNNTLCEFPETLKFVVLASFGVDVVCFFHVLLYLLLVKCVKHLKFEKKRRLLKSFKLC